MHFCHHSYSEAVAVEDKDANRDDDSDEETAQEKRIRLAKEYIAELEEQGSYLCMCKITFMMFCCYVEKLKLDQTTIDHDAIAHRLREDVVSCIWFDECQVVTCCYSNDKVGSFLRKLQTL